MFGGLLALFVWRRELVCSLTLLGQRQWFWESYLTILFGLEDVLVYFVNKLLLRHFETDRYLLKHAAIDAEAPLLHTISAMCT